MLLFVHTQPKQTGRRMTLIEVQSPPQHTETVPVQIAPVSTREIFLKSMEESLLKGQNLDQPLEDILSHRSDAEMYERLANMPTTDELRLEKFGTPLPEGHPEAPSVHSKIGASALR